MSVHPPASARLQLIVCEKTPRWAIAWRRELGEQATVIEVRALTHVDDYPTGASPLAIAVDAGAFRSAALLPAIARWTEAGAAVVVLESPQFAAAEFAFREAGAVHAVFSPSPLEPAARMLRRHWKRRRPAEAAENNPRLEQSVHERLPWARYAASQTPGPRP